MGKSTAESAGREVRLARALRANLKRRKAQGRVKAQPAGEAAQAGSGADGEGQGAAAPDETRPAPRLRPNMAQKSD